MIVVDILWIACLGIGLAHSAPLILRCTDFNITSLHEISFQCDKASTCMFANVKADSETEFAFSSELYMSTYKCLGFVHSSLERLPIDLFKHYPNIEILYAPKLGLLSVTRTLFEPASRLQDVHLQGNKLTELENFLFYGAINLRRALLSSNQITAIGKDTFKKMIIKSSDPFDITQQRKLEEIDLSSNRLTELEYGTFSQQHSLKILLLRHNNVKLKYGLFPKELMKLDLSYNNLKEFTLRQLINSNSLEELSLNGNYFGEMGIEFVFPEAIFHLMNVHRFELSDCFPCLQLADVFARFKRFNRNIIVQYDREKTNGANIFGVSCVYDSERQI